MNSNNKKSPLLKIALPLPSPPAFKHRIPAPVAAPVYKPQPPPKVAQAKKIVAPPVYRPQPVKPGVQAKMAGPPQAGRHPAAPPVYRPQPVPRVLQAKKAIAAPVVKPALGPPQPRVPKAAALLRSSSPKAIQRKVSVARNSGIIQAKYPIGAYVTVLGERGQPSWYGVVKKHTGGGYKIRVGGFSESEDDFVDVDEDMVHPHPSFAARYEVHSDGATVTTAGGTWTARKYKSIMGRVDPTVRGAHMELEFLPGPHVDATNIVLVQTVKAVKNGQPYFMNQTILDRSTGEGISIDQHHSSASPEYVATAATSGGAFGSAPTEDGAGSHGYRVFCHNPERWQAKEAWLKDRPHMSLIYTQSSQEFETTAICTAGPDKGRYYGSVKWGWTWDDHGQPVRLIALQRVSFGSASSEFRDSAIQWNATRTSGGRTPVQLPLPKI